MPKGDQGDHWDSLAANLGAVPQEPESPAKEADEAAREPEQPNEQSRQSAVAAEQPHARREAERSYGTTGGRVVSGFGHRRGSVDWANLARELGVEAVEEAPEPTPTAEVPSDGRSALVEVGGDEASKPSFRSETGRLPPSKPAQAGFGAGILDDAEVSESAAAGREIERTCSEVEEHEEERKGRRRRRRRKPKSHEREGSGDVAAEEPAPEAVRESAVEEGEEDQEADRFSRRGRRRGGRRRPEPKEIPSQGELPEHSADDFELADALADDLEDRESGTAQEVELDLDEDEDEADSRRGVKKITHRGIPSWQEAVGFIIDSNMESRSKRGDSGGGRYRPPRRRGGDKAGNRDRF